MSQIFDALLRSEAEHPENDPATHTEAHELLRSVEHQAASKWDPGPPSGQSDIAGGFEERVAFGRGAVSAEIDGLDAPAPTRHPSADDRADVLNLFQSFPISLPSESRLVCLTDRHSPTAEAFRLLSVRLRDLRRVQPLKKVLITSTVPREGKSTVAANLACTLAHRTEERVLLLEGDMRRPSQTESFNLNKASGICEWLQGESSLQKSVYRLEGAGFWILPAGNAPNAPLELLQSSKLPLLMDQIATWFDWVIIDSPPVLPLADTSIWARFADGILLVTRQGITEKHQLERGLKVLDTKKVLGALLNCSQVSTYSSYYYRPSLAS